MHSLIPFIKTFGYFGIFAVIFAESGLLIGFLFPGDTLLFAAGLLASHGHLNISILIAVAFAAAVTGDSAGYWIGKKAGPKLFVRDNSLFFKKEYVARAQAFFSRHGGRTIVLARYVPVVRTFAPVVAGAANMPYREFFAYNVIGGAAWCGSITLLGYYFAARIPNIDTYVMPIVGAVFVLSFVPLLAELVNRKKQRQSRDTVI